MSFFNFFKSPQISQGVDEYKSTPGALLLDVRTPEEYQEGHIPESKNLPLQSLANQAGSLIRQKSTPIFVYCHSGSRSSQTEIDEADIADPHFDPQRRTGIQMLAFLQIGLRDQPLCLLLLIHRAEAAGALTQERLHDALHLLDLKLTAVFDPRV